MNDMNDFKIITLEDKTLVANSRDIARELGIEHDNFMQTIRTHQAIIERDFGNLLFQTGTSTPNSNGAKHQIKYCLLTEDQFIFIATLSRNSAKVVQFKAKLVKAFSIARQALQEIANHASQAANTSKHPSTSVTNPFPDMESMVKQFTTNAVDTLTTGNVTPSTFHQLGIKFRSFAIGYQELETKHQELKQLVIDSSQQQLLQASQQQKLTALVQSIINDHKALSKKPRGKYSTKVSTLRIDANQLLEELAENDLGDMPYMAILETMSLLGFEKERFMGSDYWTLLY